MAADSSSSSISDEEDEDDIIMISDDDSDSSSIEHEAASPERRRSKMVVISYDVGIRNLACAIMFCPDGEDGRGEFEILKWDVVDILVDNQSKVANAAKFTDTMRVCRYLTKTLNGQYDNGRLLSEWGAAGHFICVRVEKQIGAKKPMNSTISHMLLMYFECALRAAGVPEDQFCVELINAKLKFSIIELIVPDLVESEILSGQRPITRAEKKARDQISSGGEGILVLDLKDCCCRGADKKKKSSPKKELARREALRYRSNKRLGKKCVKYMIESTDLLSSTTIDLPSVYKRGAGKFDDKAESLLQGIRKKSNKWWNARARKIIKK